MKPALAFVAPPAAPAGPGSRNDLEPCHPPRHPVASHSGRHRHKGACPFAMIAVADLLARIPRHQLQTRDGIIYAAEQFGEGLRNLGLSSPAMEEAITYGANGIAHRCAALGYTADEARDLGRLFKAHTQRWLLKTP